MLRQAVILNPADALAHGQLADFLLAEERASEAAAEYRRALELVPDHAPALNQLGAALQMLGQFEEAVVCHARALKLREQKYPSAASNCANALRKLGRYAEAEQFYRQVVAQWPEDPAAHTNLVIVLNMMSKTDEAIALGRAGIDKWPTLPETHHALAFALESAGQKDEAIAHYQHAANLVPDSQAAKYDVAAATGANAPPHAPAEYVRSLFNDYAPYFDQHLTAVLGYQVPQQLAEMIQAADARAAGNVPALDILDLGCGTGLMAPLVKPFAKSLVGVDLSQRMIVKAEERGLYDSLVLGDATELLQTQHQSFDLIIAAELVIYIGDLAYLLPLVGNALRPGGLLALSIETGEEISETLGYKLRATRRYAHSPAYVRQMALVSGLSEVASKPVSLRRAAGKMEAGELFVFKRGA